MQALVRAFPLTVFALVVACQSAAPSTAPTADQTSSPTTGPTSTPVATATMSATSSPAVTPAGTSPATPAATPSASPGSTPNPTAELPVAGTIVRTGSFAVTVATADALMAQRLEPFGVQRTDPETFEDLGDVPLEHADLDGQSMAAGKDGVWMTLAGQRAVIQIDPKTGAVTRRIELIGQPYNLVENGDDLWIADFESSEVLRLDLKSEEVVARIPVTSPTGIAYGEGSVWATVHMGRREPNQDVDTFPGGKLARIDPEKNEVVALVDVGHRPYFVTTGFGAAWTGNATSGTVSRVDAATNEVTSIPIGADGAFDIEAAPSGIWVAIAPQHWSPPCDPETSYIVRIDPLTAMPSHRVDFPCPDQITPDGDALWITGYDSSGVHTGYLVPEE